VSLAAAHPCRCTRHSKPDHRAPATNAKRHGRPMTGISQARCQELNRLAREADRLAEREGFEPSIRETRIPDFESGAFDHSAISPMRAACRDDDRCGGARPQSVAVLPGASGAWRRRRRPPRRHNPDHLAWSQLSHQPVRITRSTGRVDRPVAMIFDSCRIERIASVGSARCATGAALYGSAVTPCLSGGAAAACVRPATRRPRHPVPDHGPQPTPRPAQRSFKLPA